ncbi:MAG TPA: aldo/keto reductase, partial [Tepidiformaceae bacterium]|nr:aldo/keto reductase [Tepidiformaceae bacterium]
MELRSFGRTGIKVSSLCLGCMMFGGKTSYEDSAAIIDRALDAGVNFIDTANVYNAGRSEEATGQALKRNGKRNDVFLATKVHGRMGPGPNEMNNTRRHIIEQCEASLRRLGTDWIDLYQIHRPQSDMAIDETLRALDDLVRAGKVRYLGASTFAAWQLLESLWVSKEYGLNRFVCEQPPYNLLDRRIERELLPMAQSYGVAIIPWSPLAGGLLSGKYSRNEPPPEDSRYANLDANPMYRRRMNDNIWDVIEGLEEVAAAKNVAISQLSLAWCMQQPGVTSPIIGPRTMEQLEDNLKAAEVTFTADELKAIDRIIRPGTHVS